MKYLPGLSEYKLHSYEPLRNDRKVRRYHFTRPNLLRKFLAVYMAYWLLLAPIAAPTPAKVFADAPPADIPTVEDMPVAHFEVPTEQAELKPVYIPPPPKAATKPVFSSQGNNYYKKQCVWWAYERRMQMGNPVPGNWHSAYQWLGNAQAMGWPTGSEPRVGAVGTRGNHVVVVERVNNDGTIYLSEMNYDFNGGFRYRTAPASNFLYIY